MVQCSVASHSVAWLSACVVFQLATLESITAMKAGVQVLAVGESLAHTMAG